MTQSWAVAMLVFKISYCSPERCPGHLFFFCLIEMGWRGESALKCFPMMYRLTNSRFLRFATE